MAEGPEVAALLSGVWFASVVLIEQVPTLAAAALPGPHPRPLSAPCIPRSSLLPGPVCPRSLTKSWCGVGRAKVFTQLGQGNSEVAATGVELFLPYLQNGIHILLAGGVQASPSLLSILVVFPVAKGHCLPCRRPQDRDSQTVT